MLRQLPEWNRRRRQIAERYRFLLEDVPQVQPVAASEGEPVYHLFVVQTDERDEVRQRLDAAGIATGVHYPIPLHLQPAFAGLGGAVVGDLAVTAREEGRILS